MLPRWEREQETNQENNKVEGEIHAREEPGLLHFLLRALQLKKLFDGCLLLQLAQDLVPHFYVLDLAREIDG